MSEPPELIAHRGLMRDYPENTLTAFRAALEAGARWLELDVQFSSDGVPMVIHDDTLDRTTRETGSVLDRTAEELADVPVQGPQRLGEQSARTDTIPRLSDAVGELNAHPGVTLFVEIKRQSLMRFGVEECVDSIEQIMAEARFDWVLISFIQDAVEYARRRHRRPIGWVLRDYNLTARRIAEIMRPEYLFCNQERLLRPLQQLWPGTWKWVIYDAQDIDEALGLGEAGADLVETGCIDKLLEPQHLEA